jgi:hypothetical protein
MATKSDSIGRNVRLGQSKAEVSIRPVGAGAPRKSAALKIDAAVARRPEPRAYEMAYILFEPELLISHRTFWQHRKIAGSLARSEY